MSFDNIRWLVQSSFSYPDILAGEAPINLLNRREQAKLATLHVDKRRRDWLLGRQTAKQLLQSVLHDDGVAARLEQIEIDNDPDGAPFASLRSDDLADVKRLPWSLSISHSNGAACSAVHSTATVGVDMERIETREWNFVRAYFSSAEIELVEGSSSADRALLITAIWSGKEAVLKVLREGLRLDTRTITCLFDVKQASTRTWIPFEIELQDALIGSLPNRWSGWWRSWNADVPFVLTLATREE